MQVLLNKQEKEKIVIRLHKEGKTIRDIEHEVHISFTDTGKIIRKINGLDNDVMTSNDITANETEDMLQEFWVLNQLQIKNYLDLFLRLFHIMKKNKLLNEKDIKTVLKYAFDLPSLEIKFRSLANNVLDLEIKSLKNKLDASKPVADEQKLDELVSEIDLHLIRLVKLLIHDLENIEHITEITDNKRIIKVLLLKILLTTMIN